MDQQDSLTNKYLTERDAVYTPKEGFKRTLIFFHGLTSNGPKIHDKCLLGKEYRPFPLVIHIEFCNSLGFSSCFPYCSGENINMA